MKVEKKTADRSVWVRAIGSKMSFARLGTKGETRCESILVSMRITTQQINVLITPTRLQISLAPLFPGMRYA